jgi:hypothetical protein
MRGSLPSFGQPERPREGDGARPRLRGLNRRRGTDEQLHAFVADAVVGVSFQKAILSDIRWSENPQAGQSLHSISYSGRPPISLEVRALIKRFALENGWGARKVHAELGKLGFTRSLD